MKFILLAFFFGWTYQAHAQFADSLRVTVGTTGTVATKDYQPLWVVANRYGVLTDQRADFATHAGFSNEHIFTSQPATSDRPGAPRQRGLYLQYGADVYNNNHFNSFFLAEGYVKLGYKHLQLRGGRYHEYTGELDQTLSSGSFGISGNALPMPKLDLAVVDYTPVPFTKGFVQFKGQFAHGWFTTANNIEGAYLHQKSLYIKVGREHLSFYGGLTHFAQWGGTFPSGKAPSRFKDYLRIVAGASGNNDDPVYHQGPIDIDNAVGNHLLIPDFGVILRNPRATFRLYTQTIFDKGVADTANLNQRDKLAGLKILSRDRLVGVSWEQPKGSFLQKIVLEGIYTKYQGGPVQYQGRDNYYNNGTYTMGWQYQSQILGTPLFINRERASHYNLDQAALSGWSVVSNRVVGVHVGAKGSLNSRMDFRALATYVQHYGNYYDDAAFTPAKRQAHLLLEVPYYLPQLTITAAVGGDYGDLSTVTAGLLRVEWHLR
jgi:hypothetical protein